MIGEKFKVPLVKRTGHKTEINLKSKGQMISTEFWAWDIGRGVYKKCAELRADAPEFLRYFIDGFCYIFIPFIFLLWVILKIWTYIDPHDGLDEE